MRTHTLPFINIVDTLTSTFIERRIGSLSPTSRLTPLFDRTPSTIHHDAEALEEKSQQEFGGDARKTPFATQHIQNPIRDTSADIRVGRCGGNG
ncbi:hypothetical protein PM082_009767 [Marasmius tenuissimus]|nr:hypothetical protein PM082_009767 [Marasmius tenuissimus]